MPRNSLKKSSFNTLEIKFDEFNRISKEMRIEWTKEGERGKKREKEKKEDRERKPLRVVQFYSCSSSCLIKIFYTLPPRYSILNLFRHNSIKISISKTSCVKRQLIRPIIVITTTRTTAVNIN